MLPSISDAVKGVKRGESWDCHPKIDEAIGDMSMRGSEEIGLTRVAGAARIRRVLLIRPETERLCSLCSSKYACGREYVC